MAIRSGLASQIGIGAETTYGTPVTPTEYIEFNSESLVYNIHASAALNGTLTISFLVVKA